MDGQHNDNSCITILFYIHNCKWKNSRNNSCSAPHFYIRNCKMENSRDNWYSGSRRFHPLVWQYSLVKMGHEIIPTIILSLVFIESIFLFWHNAMEFPSLIWAATWQNQQNGMCTQQRLRSAWAFAQSGVCPGWSESSLGAQSFCWFGHGMAHLWHVKRHTFWLLEGISHICDNSRRGHKTWGSVTGTLQQTIQKSVCRLDTAAKINEWLVPC